MLSQINRAIPLRVLPFLFEQGHPIPATRPEEYRKDAAELRAGAAEADTAAMRRTLLEAAVEMDILADKIERLEGRKPGI